MEPTLDSARLLLCEHFGHDTFREGQEQVISHLVAGRSAAAVFPTGGGKSLCYQLPALLFDGLTLVVSPLIALMKDQIDQLKGLGFAAERLDSSLTAEEHGAIMSAVRQNRLKILYAAPERFNNERFRETIQRLKVSLFAVDEAHCVSEWGHNFRPDYLKLAAFARSCRAQRILTLTATATPRVLDDICASFTIDPECAVRTGFYRPNLSLLTSPVTSAERDTVLLERLKSREPEPTIVYVTLQRTAERVAEALAARGLPARPYHAGMEDDDRAATQDWFLASKEAVVVATIAFGMGIDKPDIRYVYHYNLAKSLENYSQEIGRAGRDDKPSICETLACTDDLGTLSNFAYGDTPDPSAVRSLLTDLADKEERFDVSFTDLAYHHDIRILVVRTLITYLEIEGMLEAGTPYFARYRFRPAVGFEEILGRFKGERRLFLEGLFGEARKARTWYDIQLRKAAVALESPRERLVRALDYLDEQRLLEVKVSGVQHRFRWLERPHDLEALALRLHGRAVAHEQREIERLSQVLDLAGHDGCQTALLCEHFGETLAKPCGHCSWCLNGGQPVELPEPAVAVVNEQIWQEAADLRRETTDELGEPRAFARFLTGLSSPRLTRKRLTRHPLFGACAKVPFTTVLSRITNLSP